MRRTLTTILAALLVMAALEAAIQFFSRTAARRGVWMAGLSPAMTELG